MIINKLDFFWTERFLENYNRYGGQRARIRSRINEIRRKIQSDPLTWSRNMERLQAPNLVLFRDKLTEGDRIIFTYDKELIFVDVGPHHVMKEFSELGFSQQSEIISKKQEIPSWFFMEFENIEKINPFALKKEANVLDNSELRWLFEEELNESWLQFLDSEQAKLKSNLFESLKSPGNFEFHLILGGAGTGKSIVLLNLALSLSESGRNVICQFNDQVLKYFNSGKQRVPGANLEMQPGSVVLLDDPANLATLKKKLAEARRNNVRALVVALDPFQWVERRVYENFNELLELTFPTIHNLTICYRQSKAVGSLALDFTKSILNKTSPFIIESKIEDHKKQIDPLKEICVEKVEFVDDGGRFRIYENNLDSNFKLEFERFKKRDDKWNHWHPALLIFDSEGSGIPAQWVELIRGNNVLLKSLNQIHLIRGAEFQEVFLLLHNKTWRSLQEGVLGADSVTWAKLLGLHTVFTRAKDVTILFIA